MNLPNFFIIGAPKSGTTALSEYLAEHPNIFMCNPKEPDYFYSDFSNKYKMNKKKYLALFAGAKPDIHRAIGEASTTYLFSKRAVKEILEFNPESRFIVMLRNPLDLVQAFHSQQVFIGGENVVDFEEAWRIEKDRKSGAMVPPHCFDPKRLLYSEWGLLGDQMERLFSNVDKSRVKVIFFQDFVNNTKKIYEEVLGFLGVPSTNKSHFPKINENMKFRSRKLQEIFSVLTYWALMFRVKFGLKGFGIFRRLLLLNNKPAKRNVLNENFKKQINLFYKSDILKLSKITGRDLSDWQ